MGTSAQSRPDTCASRLVHRCRQAWQTASEVLAVTRLNDETLSQIARDVSTTPDQILHLVKNGPHAADEVSALMRALDLDTLKVARAHPRQLRDMQINCANCTAKARCRRDLARRDERQAYRSYCGNVDFLDGLRSNPELLSS